MMGEMVYIYYGIALVFGVLVGSFLNVLILRIPEGEDVVREASHCPHCGRILQFSELVPVLSYAVQGGKCRGCEMPISIQYPLVESLNACLWLVLFWELGFSWITVCYALVASMLLAIAVIDARTMEIDPTLNKCILVLGVIVTVLDRAYFSEHLIGMAIVSVPLIIVMVFTNEGIGGGDIKLMATCGLVLGWYQILLGFVLGCVVGSLLHIVRMALFGAERRLALGPYLAFGVYVSMIWGSDMVLWYLSKLG